MSCRSAGLSLVALTFIGLPAVAQQQQPPAASIAVAFADTVLKKVNSCWGSAWSEAMTMDIQFSEIRLGRKPDSTKTAEATRQTDECVTDAKAYVEANYRTARDAAGNPATAVTALKDLYAYFAVALEGVQLSSTDISSSRTLRTSDIFRRRSQPFLDEIKSRVMRVRAEF